MNKTKLIIGAVLFVAVLGGVKACKGESESVPQETVKKDNSEAINKAAVEVIKKEPKVKDAFLTDANILYVAVESDGTDRSGYASYICETLKENKAKIDAVKVVEFGTTNSPDKDNAYGVLLGESRCN
ncbi:hypothetical protein JJC03_15575 [Flavobacterium oreochromis]|uniref:hypothetical protein n=1 Tax=Flavobacterium oreochromis TaxID=2906078 RepID=UPI001CE70F0F|nr:hypothetical protein [Flavobacterium oreochromis]QYS86319.1 hypothetical protein JJC03_15575 [Flavobacterium oreochromis]